MSQAFSVFNPPRAESGEAMLWPKLEGLALALALSAMARRDGGMMLVVCADGYAARRIRDDINHIGQSQADLFPDLEVLPYDLYSPHPDLISRRIEVLSKLPGRSDGLLIAPVSALMQRLAPRTFILGQSLDLRTDQTLVPDAFRNQLMDAGYQPSDQVWQPGQFALRGSIVDLWPMGTAVPFRIEWFDDEIESIRSFDAETQRSISKLDRLELLPGREYPFDEDARQAFRRRFRNRFDVDLRHATVYQDIGEGIQSQGLDQYLPLFFDHTNSLLDYVPNDHRLVVLDGVDEAMSSFSQQVDYRFDQRRGDRQRPILEPHELYWDQTQLGEQIRRNASVRMTQRMPAKASVSAVDVLDLDQASDQ
ncbi:MAG: transcription-repair coupling factor, partial [Pseudomonadota bacterium]